MANIRDVFADNLRGLLSERGAMAALSRATGISRVQLNRYLKGTIPSESNLARIADYLGVEEHSLFAKLEQHPRRFERFLTLARRASRVQSTSPISSNWMAIYFKVPSSDTYVVRSITLLSVERGQRTFERFTRLAPAGTDGPNEPVNLHSGIACEIGSYEYHLGIHTNEPLEPTFLGMQSAPTSYLLSRGTASVLTTSGPTALPIVAERMEGFISTRDAQMQAGTISLSAIANGQLVQRMLSDPTGDEMKLYG